MSRHPLAVPGLLDDPYPIYASLRESRPVCRVERPDEPGLEFVLTRYRDVHDVLRDDRFSVNRLRSPRVRALVHDLPDDMRPEAQLPSMLTVDPPHHTRLRGLVSRAFTPRRIAALEDTIRGHVDAHLRNLTGEVDLVAGLAAPLPATVIAELLGVPAADHARFRAWSHALLGTLVGGERGPEEARLAGFQRARDALRDYLRRCIEERRRTPRDDLISGLVEAQQAGDALSDDELLATCTLLLVAGHETTTNLIANGTAALLARRPLWERLCEEPALLEPAVEEMLRFDGPFQAVARVATVDCEIGGTCVPAGSLVSALLGAANRDPEVFAAPDRFDPARQEGPHLAFGIGIHFCLGSALARLEARLVFEALTQRHPGLQRSERPAVRTRSIMLRGYESLPVKLG